MGVPVVSRAVVASVLSVAGLVCLSVGVFLLFGVGAVLVVLGLSLVLAGMTLEV